MPRVDRRKWIAAMGGGLGAVATPSAWGEQGPEWPGKRTGDLKIVDLRITPIALPDPPLLNVAGCHGPYFLRNVVQLETDSGIVGIGETHGGENLTRTLEESRRLVVGQSVFAYRKMATDLRRASNACYAAIELACLDAMGRATGRRVCELLGGPVREQVELAAYLFFRYSADHPRVRDDPRLVRRANGGNALDDWGEVLTPKAMAEMAQQFHQKWGFRVHKLKAGVLSPDVELETLEAIHDRLGEENPLRIDPNGRWTVETATRIGHQMKDLPLEYYEDPVHGQEAMAQVRRQTQLPMSTNSCVTSFRHIPKAIRREPIDVVLGDHHGWGGITAFQTLGTLAPALGWGLSHHSNNHAGITMAAMIHAGAVTPELTYASDTHYPWLVEGADIIQGPNLKIEKGHMPVPSGRGLGVELDPDKLAQAHEVYRQCGMRRRDDGSTMRRFQPQWNRARY
jgi:glucarate dehydratase